MPIKAVLFDLDDTLIDWSGFKGSWWGLEPQHLTHVHNHLAAEMPDVKTSTQDFIDNFTRRSRAGWDGARDTLIAPHLGEMLFDTAAALGYAHEKLDMERLLSEYRWGVAEGVVAFPEVPKVLEKLRSHGFELGIITNSFVPMRLRDIEIQAHGLMPYFPRFRYSAADLGYLKPHPEVFRAALKAMNVTPKEAIFVGDSLPADIIGAQSAGMRAVWRKLSHHNGQPRDPNVIPDAQIRTMDDLMGIIAMWL